MLPVPELIEFNILKIMHKRYYQKLPPSLMEIWERNTDRNDRALRNQYDFFLDHFRLMSYKQHPFFHFPRTWNKLDNNLKNIDSYSIFCESVKKFLIERVYNEHLQNLNQNQNQNQMNNNNQ